jgi:hypothetical protein
MRTPEQIIGKDRLLQLIFEGYEVRRYVMGKASDAFRAALLELVDQYVETPSNADDAIAALYERADALRAWKEKRELG